MEKYLPRKVNVLPLNVPAGGGAKGVNQLYRARPDGYTIGIMNIPGLFILQERGGGYDLNRLTWLAGLGKDPYAMAVPWNSPIKTVADLQALSKTRPVKFTTNGPEGTAYGVTLIATDLLGIRLQLITGYEGSSEYVAAAVRGHGDDGDCLSGWFRTPAHAGRSVVSSRTRFRGDLDRSDDGSLPTMAIMGAGPDEGSSDKNPSPRPTNRELMRHVEYR